MLSSKLRSVPRFSVVALWYGLGEKPDCAQLTSSVLESGLGGAWDSARLESDPAKLLPQILDQLIALGQTAEQLRQVLGGNGHQPEKVFELTKQLLQGGDHAP